MSSNEPLMTSSPTISKTNDVTNPIMVTQSVSKGESQTTLDESGISSKGSSMMDDCSASPGVLSSSAPSTPMIVPRKKPPPKPPRMRSYLQPNSDISSGQICYDSRLSPSPSEQSKCLEANGSPHSSLADVTNTFDASVAGSTDGSVILRHSPHHMKAKVYQILVQTREFLFYEINPENILPYLCRKQVISPTSEQEIRRCSSKQSMCEMLLDIITSKGQEEFAIFCDALRIVDKQEYLSELLMVLDKLIDTLTLRNQNQSPKDKDKTVMDKSVPPKAEAEEIDLGDAKECEICGNTDGSEATLSDCESFDIDISYFDTEMGDMKNLRDVATVKKKKRTKSADGNESFLDKLSQEKADRFVPVISLSLYNQCLFCSKINTLAKILETHSCIRELSLAKNHVDGIAMGRLGQALEKNRGLVKLDIRLNTIGDDGARSLSDGLRRSHSLKTLNVSSTDLSGPGCNILLEGLVRNISLTELDVGFNDLRDDGCRGIAKLLISNTNLRKLRMRDNGISDTGAHVIFKALKKNSRVTTLDMSSNKLGRTSYNTLAEMLLCNRALKELNLEKCHISQAGCRALARALKTNTSLRSIDLSMNPLGDAGAESLSDGLKYNQVLDTLCLNMCSVGNRGFLRVLEALSYNMAMTSLKMCYNKIGQPERPRMDSVSEEDSVSSNETTIEEVYETLCRLLQFNKNLKVLLWGNKLNETPNNTLSRSRDNSVDSLED